MNRLNNAMYVVYSNSSRNGALGLRPTVMRTLVRTVVEAASCELSRAGQSLEDMVGVEMIEDADGNFQPERELSFDEVVELSIQKLGDDGRLYEVYEDTDEGREAFVEAASEYGLYDKSLSLVDGYTT